MLLTQSVNLKLIIHSLLINSKVAEITNLAIFDRKILFYQLRSLFFLLNFKEAIDLIIDVNINTIFIFSDIRAKKLL